MHKCIALPKLWTLGDDEHVGVGPSIVTNAQMHWVLMVGEAVVCRAGVHGKSLYPLLNFSVNLKLLRKIKCIYIKDTLTVSCPGWLELPLDPHSLH